MAIITWGNTDGSNITWTKFSSLSNWDLISNFVSWLMCVLTSKLFRRRLLVWVRAGQWTSRCSMFPLADAFEQRVQDPSLSEKCLTNWSVLYRPDSIFAWITALQISKLERFPRVLFRLCTVNALNVVKASWQMKLEWFVSTMAVLMYS